MQMIFFKDYPPFGFQIQRLIAEIPGGGAEMMEISWAVERMAPEDFESWRDAWEWLAARVAHHAERDIERGHAVSARERLFRAANYYRSSEFFIPHDDERKISTWRKMTDAFSRAADLHEPSFEWFRVEVESDGTLPGYLVKPPVAGKHPAVLYLNGADGTKEESWYLAGRAFVERGVAFAAIDGPGQGEPLRLNQMYTRPDYETVIAPVFDYLAARKDIDESRIGLAGISMGGYYAGRVAAYDHRFRCFGLHGACHNVLEDLYKFYPNIRRQLQWVTGTFDDAKARDVLAEFDLGPHLGRVQKPVYICHGAEDHVVDPKAAEKTLRALPESVERQLRWWGKEEGGALHANVDNPSEAYPDMIDWMVHQLRS